MLSYKHIPLTSFLALLLGIAGCAHYNAKPLVYIAPQPGAKQSEQILFKYRIFTTNDCKKYFDRNIIAAGYQPVQIMIHNNSARYLSLNLNRFNAPVVNLGDIAQEFHTSTKRRAAGYGIAALFIWPFAIPAIVDGIGSSQANRKLDEDFSQKTLRDQTIAPYSSINGVICLPSYARRKEITVTLLDQQTGEPFLLSTTKTSSPATSNFELTFAVDKTSDKKINLKKRK